MTTTIARKESATALTVQDLFLTGMFPQFKNPTQAAMAFEAGRALSLTPFESLKNISVIGGNLAFSAALFAMLIKRHGYKYIAKTTAAEAACEVWEHWEGKGWVNIGTFSFTVDDAKAAGLWGRGQWAKYPKAMLWARAVSGAARSLCPDAIMGKAYTHEELGSEPPAADVDEVVATTDDGEIIEAEECMPSDEFRMTLDAMRDCETLDDLTVIAGSLKDATVSQGQRKEAASVFRQRKGELEHDRLQAAKEHPMVQEAIDAFGADIDALEVHA